MEKGKKKWNCNFLLRLLFFFFYTTEIEILNLERRQRLVIPFHTLWEEKFSENKHVAYDTKREAMAGVAKYEVAFRLLPLYWNDIYGKTIRFYVSL